MKVHIIVCTVSHKYKNFRVYIHYNKLKANVINFNYLKSFSQSEIC